MMNPQGWIRRRGEVRYLLIHGHQFDPDLDSWPKQWIVEEMDRISNAVDWGPFNQLRAEASTASQDNDNLIAGAAKLGYSTICGHSHVPQTAENFINDGSWRGPYQPHYVLFPKDKIALISDLHIGAPEAKPYENVLIDFLTFAKKQMWTLYVAGDCLDLWAHPTSEIIDACTFILNRLMAYPDLRLIGGNHDNDLKTLGRILNVSRPIPWYEFLETSDTPAVLSWPE
jgi:hypothetical protein